MTYLFMYLHNVKESSSENMQVNPTYQKWGISRFKFPASKNKDDSEKSKNRNFLLRKCSNYLRYLEYLH